LTLRVLGIGFRVQGSGFRVSDINNHNNSLRAFRSTYRVVKILTLAVGVTFATKLDK